MLTMERSQRVFFCFYQNRVVYFAFIIMYYFGVGIYNKYNKSHRIMKNKEVTSTTVKYRIAAIHLAKKIDKNKDYAKRIGVSVEWNSKGK